MHEINERRGASMKLARRQQRVVEERYVTPEEDNEQAPYA